MKKIENIFTFYFLTKEDSKYETNRNKILFDCPFKKVTEKSLDSAQYDTAQNFIPRSMILRGTSKKFEYLGENETKNETILTHWSVAQAGSNYEKNWVSKISLDCPFKTEAFTTVIIRNCAAYLESDRDRDFPFVFSPDRDWRLSERDRDLFFSFFTDRDRDRLLFLLSPDDDLDRDSFLPSERDRSRATFFFSSRDRDRLALRLPPDRERERLSFLLVSARERRPPLRERDRELERELERERE